MPVDKPETETPFFTLPFANDSFSSRCKDVFSSLETIEKKHEAYEQTRTTFNREETDSLMKPDPAESSWEVTQRKQDRTSSQNRLGRQSKSTQSNHTRNWRKNNDNNRNRRGNDGFFPPFQRPPRRSPKAVPGYKSQPEKWTCYSLDDVKNSDMSERSNQRAAFEFLAERKRAREKDQEQEKCDTSELACSKGAISFSKPKSSQGCASHKMPSTSCDSETSTSFPGAGSFGERQSSSKLKSDGKLTFNESESDSDWGDDSKKDETFDLKLKDPQTNDKPADKQFNFKARKNIKRNIRHRDLETEEDM